MLPQILPTDIKIPLSSCLVKTTHMARKQKPYWFQLLQEGCGFQNYDISWAKSTECWLLIASWNTK